MLKSSEKRAFEGLYPFPGYRLAYTHAEKQYIFEQALQFAALHGYAAPRDRCSIHVSVDMRYYNNLLQNNADAFQLRKCELDAGHKEPCRVTP